MDVLDVEDWGIYGLMYDGTFICIMFGVSFNGGVSFCHSFRVRERVCVYAIIMFSANAVLESSSSTYLFYFHFLFFFMVERNRCGVVLWMN